MSVASTSRLGASIAEVTEWWWGEVVALVPRQWHSVLFAPDRRPVLKISPGDVQIQYPDDEAETLLWQPIGEGEGLDAESPLAIAEDSAHVRFDASLGLTRRIAMPLLSAREMGGAVSLVVEQHFPYRSEDIHIAYGAPSGPPENGVVHVPVTVIERDAVAVWVERLSSGGLRIASYGVLCGDAVLSFYQDPGPIDHRGRNRRLLLAVASIMFATAALASWYMHRSAYIDFLESGISAQRSTALQARRLEARVDSMIAKRSWLSRQAEKPDLGGILETVAQRLPDDVWVDQFEWRGTQVRLTGFAADAVALPKELGKGGTFDNVQFRSAISAGNAAGGKERFDLTADLGGSVR